MPATRPLSSLRDQPFALLCEMDARLRATHDNDERETWTGLAIQIRGRGFILPQREVREVLSMPGLTRVPGAAPFLLGVASLRGNLLPVTDIGMLMGQPASVKTRKQRVVVLNSSHIPAGFLVDSVGGYREFSVADQRHSAITEMPEPEDWLLGAFVREGETWPVLSLHRIARSDEFLNADADVPARAQVVAR